MQGRTEKAPGPDRFTCLFFKKAWNIIKDDVLAALQQMFALQTERLGLLNTAHIVLLPKKEGAGNATEYRPISLIHSMAKLLTKILANRLSPMFTVLGRSKGYCPVNWRRACRAKQLGVLGIKDLICFNRALRLRWMWLRLTDDTKSWKDMPNTVLNKSWPCVELALP